jgi:hypothetical protein
MKSILEDQHVATSTPPMVAEPSQVPIHADFYVSHSTLADVETGSVPSIQKLFSLAACPTVSLEELLPVFGIVGTRRI